MERRYTRSDIGDDIFVVQDDNGSLRRVQVKTSASTVRSDSYSGQFSVSVKNLRNITNILVHYVFIVRHKGEWNKPVIIRQDYLLDHFDNNKVGSETRGRKHNVLLFLQQRESRMFRAKFYKICK